MAKKRKKQKKETPLKGNQRGVSQLSGISLRRYDLEIEEYPIRDYTRARQLIEISEYCYEVRTCLSYATRDTFASSEGDEAGFWVSDYIDTDKTVKVNPEVKAIADDLLSRKQGQEFVIGGERLKRALRDSLSRGDSFLEIAIEKEGIGRNDWGISRSLYLPTFEMFRVESDTGELEKFEQRRSVLSSDPDYVFEPPQVIQFSHEKNYLYGRSLFQPAIDGYNAWAKAKDAAQDLADAARGVGTNMNIHILAPGTTPEQKRIYKEEYRQLQSEGIVTDMFLFSGHDVRKMSGINPELRPLAETFIAWRQLLIPGFFPTYYFHGLETRSSGAKEIAGAPALNYQRARWSWCSLLSKGIRQAIDTEIILKKGYEWWNKEAKYIIQWSEWNIVPYQSQESEVKSQKEDEAREDSGRYLYSNSRSTNGYSKNKLLPPISKPAV